MNTKLLVPMILTSMISAAGYFNAGFILCIGLTVPLLFRNEKSNKFFLFKNVTKMKIIRYSISIYIYPKGTYPKYIIDSYYL